MRKSLIGAAGVSLMIGLVVSCGDTQGSSGPNPEGVSGEAGDGSGGKDGVSQGGSASGKAGSHAAGAADDGSGGAVGGNPAENPGGSGESTGGALATAGADTGEGGARLGDGGRSGNAGDRGDAAGAGGSPAEIPSCDDGKATTEDIYSKAYGCAHRTDDVPGGGDGWLKYDAGFFVDERTGSAWSPITTSGSLEAAQTFCADLQIGSLVDWQVPTIDQVRASFAGGCPATAPTGSCTIHDPTNLSTTEVYSAACESCIGSGTSAYCPKNAPFCSWLKTSSVCSNCAGSQGWTYGPTNGNFAAIDLTSSLGISCVIGNLPSGLP